MPFGTLMGENEWIIEVNCINGVGILQRRKVREALVPHGAVWANDKRMIGKPFTKLPGKPPGVLQPDLGLAKLIAPHEADAARRPIEFAALDSASPGYITRLLNLNGCRIPGLK